MDERYLTILEVSQKQSYIFSSNKLKDNIFNSAVIERVMSPDYFEYAVNDKGLFSKENNLVYSGGGHIVLEFESREKAVAFTKKITSRIYREYHGIEVFAKTEPYMETDKNGKNISPGENIKSLLSSLERKKSIRRASFRQGSFGIEKMDSYTFHPVMKESGQKKNILKPEELPSPYQSVYYLQDLGGDKDRSNFIAVVHIDGNAMGKRVEDLQKTHGNDGWHHYKEMMKKFSESIDKDFKSAYQDMVGYVAKNLDHGRLKELKLTDNHFPVRRIIGAGDDICFVSEGRIGLECAAVFLKSLSDKINEADHKRYAACAGVAIVHQKYPFYRAYETAEHLCSKAKAFGVSLDAQEGKNVSAIDWHIEYGEMGNSLDEIRNRYQALDGKQMEMRPYIVTAPDAISQKEPIRQYSNFKKLITKLVSEEISYARGKIKELRTTLKQGETSARYFLKFHNLEEIILESYYDVFKDLDYFKAGTGQKIERPVFIQTSDHKFRSYLFDAVELIDTYLGLEDIRS